MKSFSVQQALIVLTLILGIIAIIFTQFATPTLYGADGYLHIRIAELIKKSGPLSSFRWARFSAFSNFFADKSFLYHLILIPFTFTSNILLGAKLAACFFAVLFLTAFFILLRKYCSSFLIPVFIAAVFLSGRFLCTLSITRPMVFAITLTLLAIYFLIEKNLLGVFAVTVIYCLSHISGPYILFYALLTEAVRYFSKREFYLKSIIVVFLSIVASYLIHPNFPNNFLAFYLNGILVPLYGIKGGFELAGEHLPLTTKEFLLGYPMVTLGLLFLLFLAIFFRPQTKFATRVIFVHAALLLILSFFSHRYLVHGYPFAILLLASYTSDYFQDQANFKDYRKNRVLIAGSIVIFCFLTFLSGWRTCRDIRLQAAFFKARNGHYEQIASWMNKNIPAGELIFHTSWIDASFFAGINPKNDYFVVLHPFYMYWGTPEVYNLYRNLSWGRTKDPYSILINIFKAKYGYANKSYALMNQIRGDSRFKILFEDDKGLVFRLD